MKKLINPLLILFTLTVVFYTCSRIGKVYYMRKYNRCVKHHYEERWTGGRSVSTMQGTSNRKQKIKVCDEYILDSILDTKFIWI